MPEGKLHIGWSQIEIAPPKKTLLQGQFHARLADTAISPLTAVMTMPLICFLPMTSQGS